MLLAQQNANANQEQAAKKSECVLVPSVCGSGPPVLPSPASTVRLLIEPFPTCVINHRDHDIEAMIVMR
eukprot:2685781-Prymnesium_polylepis.1